LEAKYRMPELVEMEIGQGGCGKCGGFVFEEGRSAPHYPEELFMLKRELVCINCGARRTLQGAAHSSFDRIRRISRIG